MNFSTGETVKVDTTELTNDVVQLLGLLKSALADDPWKHCLNFVCKELFPSLAVEVTFHKASLDSLVTRILATVVWVKFLVLEVSFGFTLCVEKVKAIIVAALEGFEWCQLYCHIA